MKLTTIPTSEVIMFIISTGIEVILANNANRPMSTKVATPEDAANLVFIKNNFFNSSLLITT
jgi:hypothetical protein